jgi:hypothetical protein
MLRQGRRCGGSCSGQAGVGRSRRSPRHLGRDRKTICAYSSGKRQPGRRASARPYPLAPFAAYLIARFTDDPHIWATALYYEAVPFGFGCSYISFARQLRLAGLRPALRGVLGGVRLRGNRDRPPAG